MTRRIVVRASPRGRWDQKGGGRRVAVRCGSLLGTGSRLPSVPVVPGRGGSLVSASPALIVPTVTPAGLSSLSPSPSLVVLLVLLSAALLVLALHAALVLHPPPFLLAGLSRLLMLGFHRSIPPAPSLLPLVLPSVLLAALAQLSTVLPVLVLLRVVPLLMLASPIPLLLFVALPAEPGLALTAALPSVLALLLLAVPLTAPAVLSPLLSLLTVLLPLLLAASLLVPVLLVSLLSDLLGLLPPLLALLTVLP